MAAVSSFIEHRLDRKTGLFIGAARLPEDFLACSTGGIVSIYKNTEPSLAYNSVAASPNYINNQLFKGLHAGNISFLKGNGFELIKRAESGTLWKKTAYEEHRKPCDVSHDGKFTYASIVLAVAENAEQCTNQAQVAGLVNLGTKVVQLHDPKIIANPDKGLLELILRKSEYVRQALDTNFGIYAVWKQLAPGELQVKVSTRFCTPANSRSAGNAHDELASKVRQVVPAYNEFFAPKPAQLVPA